MTEKRYKERADYSPAEHLRDLQARPDERPRFETDEYRRKKCASLRKAGLAEEAAEIEAASGPGDSTEVENLTPDDHYRQLPRRQ